MGIFADYAGKYYDMGYSPIPVNGKAPVVKDWSKWCRERASETELERLVHEFGACNIGIACGPASGGLVFVDNDADVEKYPLVDNILRRVLPPTPVERIGSKGYALAYRMEGDAHFSPIKNKDGATLFELLRVGRQAVIPPSIHPDTSAPYIWVNDDLIEYPPDELPVITMDMLNECADEIRAAYPGGNTRTGISGEFRSPDGFRSPHGSQERMKALANSMLHRGVTLDYAVNELLNEDKKIHDVCYFSDPRKISDAKSDHAWLNAARFYLSNVESAARNGKVPRPGDTGGVPEDRRYPTKKYGFYFAETNKDNGEIIYKTPDFNGYSQFFCDKYKPITIPGSTGGNTWVYNGKCYEYLPYITFGNGVRKATNHRSGATQTKEFFTRVQFDSAGGFGKSPAGFLNLANGVLNIEKRSIAPHSHEFKFKYVLDHLSFDADAKCQKWNEFLESALQGDQDLIRTLQLYVGYILIGGYPWLHQALCLYGGGRNGKGVFVDTIKALIGPANYSSTPMKELPDRFKRISLDGKLANFDEEADSVDPFFFKNAVAGGTISAERKGQDVYEFNNEARMVANSNELIKFKDKSRGCLDRLLHVPFTRYYKPEERDPELRDKLLAELPGVLNWALDGADTVRGMKTIPQTMAMDELMDTYRQESDSAYRFAREQVVFDGVSGFVSFMAVYKAYGDWCYERRIQAMGDRAFGKQFKSAIEEILSSGLTERETTITVENVFSRADGARGYRNIRKIDGFFRDVSI